MDDHRMSAPDWLPPGVQLTMWPPYSSTPNSAAASYAWQGGQLAHESGLPISPLNVGNNSAHAVSVAPTMSPSPTPAILGWHGANEAAALATYAPAGSHQLGLPMRLRSTPSPIVINPQQRHQRQMHDAFERYVVQGGHVYGHQTPAVAGGAPPGVPTPVAFWGPPHPPIQLRGDLHPAAEPDLAGPTLLVRPQPMRPLPAPLTGSPLPPFAHSPDAFSKDICGHAAGEQPQHLPAVAAAEPAARNNRARRASARGRQTPACDAQTALLLCTEPGLSASGRAQAAEAGEHASSASAPCADMGEAPQVPQPDSSAAPGGHERQSAREHGAAKEGTQGGAGLQSGHRNATPEPPVWSSGLGHVSDMSREVTPAAMTARDLAPCSPDTLSQQEDGSDVSVDIVALSQSPGSSVEIVELCQASDSSTTAAESLRLAQAAEERGAEEPRAPSSSAHQNQHQPAAIQCSEPTMQSVNCPAQDCSEVGAASEASRGVDVPVGVSVPVELREDDITAERHRLERDIAAAAVLGGAAATAARAIGESVARLVTEPCTLGSRSMVDEQDMSGRRARVFEPCTELCHMGGAGKEAAPALGRGPRVTAPCTERSALAAGRSKRVPGGDPLANVHVRRLCEMLRGNSHDFQAAGRVLRLKQYVSADIKPAHIDAILDALAVNTRVEVLYIQNFEWGMLDAQLEHLEAVLRLRRIWALNVGENFQITLSAWARFTAVLPHTAVAYLYVSEHHLGGTNLKIAMRNAIRVNRKRDPARDPEVISKVGNMWFNPRMPGQPSRKRAREMHAEAAEDAALQRRKIAAQAPSPLPRKTAAEKAAERAAQKQAAALERAALPAWLPAAVVDALQRAVQGPQGQPQQGEGAQTPAPKPANSQTALKRRVRSPLVNALREDPTAATLTEEEGRQASLTWILQRWRGMATAGNVWAPSIIATAAEQQQQQEEALAAAAAAAAEAAAAAAAAEAEAAAAAAEATAAAAAAAKAAAQRDREMAAASAQELSRRKRAAGRTVPSSVSLREMVAAAGNRCTFCQTQNTSMWRRFEGFVCCNACGCRCKRWKEQESAKASLAESSHIQEQRNPQSAAVEIAAVQGTADSQEMPAALPAAQQSVPLASGERDSAAAVTVPVTAADLQESMQAGSADEEITGAATAGAEAVQRRTGPGSALATGPAAGPETLPAAQRHAPSAGGRFNSVGAAAPAMLPQGTELSPADVDDEKGLAAAAAEPRQHSKARAGRLVSPAAARAATAAVERGNPSQKKESTAAVPGPAAGTERGRQSAAVDLETAADVPAIGSSPQRGSRSRAAALHSEAATPTATAGVERSMQTEAIASSGPAAVPAAASTTRRTMRPKGAGSGSAVVGTAAAGAPLFTTRSGFVRMVSPPAVLPAVPAIQRGRPPGALHGQRPILVVADRPGRKVPGKPGAGKKVRAAAAPTVAPAPQRSTRAGADSSAAALADAPAKNGTEQPSALAAVPAVQRSGRLSDSEGAAAAPAAEPRAPAVPSRPQRAAKLAAPQLWRQEVAGDADSGEDDPPPKPKPRATLRLNAPAARIAKPAVAARGLQGRVGRRPKLPARAAKLAIARAKHLSRRADELNYFGARPRSALGRHGRSRLLQSLVESVPVEGKRHRSVTLRMQEAIAGPRHALGAIGVSSSKRKLHEEPQGDQQSSDDEEPAADGGSTDEAEDSDADKETDKGPARGHATPGARKFNLRSGQAGSVKPSAPPSRTPVGSKRRLPEELPAGQHSLRKSSRLRH